MTTGSIGLSEVYFLLYLFRDLLLVMFPMLLLRKWLID